MPKKTNIPIDYTSRDFTSIKEDLVDYAQRYYPNSFKDFTAASFGGMVLDSVAYVGDILSYYLDYSVNETFLDTAIEFDNIRKHANALGYNFNGSPSSFGLLSLFIIVPSNSEGTAPNTLYLPTIQRGSRFSSGAGQFTLTEDVSFNSPKADFVAARFNSTTGATTHFAVKAMGLVRSGFIQSAESDLTNTSFEKFKRIRVGPSSITDIISVFDSEGHRYHEVDNLAQEVIFIETTNRNAINDGVRSILKPYVTSRRFVVQRDDTGTYIQFGFGSNDEDDAGIIEPSKVALKMHGKNVISNNSFDPTKLVSTNKLGISPYNTKIKITFATNTEVSTAASANSITQIIEPRLYFKNSNTLSQSLLSEVRVSLECTNEDSINATSTDISNEELKQRAKAHYATQNRAVTKQDYESLCYNMPSKFGSIKRANIVNDPSSTNRRISLYIVSEDANGSLSRSNSVIKNNLKNWISHYKMLNDVIDIRDAKIINFSVDFSVITDRAYNASTVLSDCYISLKKYFSDTFYIGEPIYITKIHENLNKVDGVVSVNKVNIKNKFDGVYSSNSMNFDNALSRDGTYIKAPKNVVFELKYPNIDIKGTAK